LREQLQDSRLLKDPVFLNIRSYFGTHWDIVFSWETWLQDGAQEILPKDPFIKAEFHQVGKLPRHEIADDHLEVIDGMLHPSEEDR
jgi:hypothetical protein